ncbi:hypothetical protein BPT24_167 [Tenacibaculum phage pT24]|uniref:Uncharacterized protein n=1 Tax=Tenacibaculum phage pT24 TaxID=1880590 RepID=A0A1B4XWV7_9CAUD|nr:hypothetical protein HYP10_gp167 [Tenacibaculum phage pT24]BAV39293.1 hypothetical protein BPT24_167 [Tenacibaculum phage pT24]
MSRKLIVKGIDPSNFMRLIIKSALVRDKKGDKIAAESLPLMITGDKIKSLKETKTETTCKYWYEDLSLFCENADEVKEILGDNTCRIWLFSCKSLVSGCLKHFKEKVNLEIILDDGNFDAVEYVSIFNESAKIKFSVGVASATFDEYDEEDLNDIFDVSRAKCSFSLSDDELKKIKQASKMEYILGKSHDAVSFVARDGSLYFKTFTVEIKLHDTDVEFDEFYIKKDVIETIDAESHNVFITNWNNTDCIIVNSVDSDTFQYIGILNKFNTSIDLESVEEEIEAVDYASFDGMDENPLF